MRRGVAGWGPHSALRCRLLTVRRPGSVTSVGQAIPPGSLGTSGEAPGVRSGHDAPDGTSHEEVAAMTDFRNGSLNLHYLHVNKPKRGRTCRTCHATHASNQPKHIRTGVPYGKWEIPIRFNKSDTGGGSSPGCHKPRDYDRQNPVTYPVPKPGTPPTDPNSPSK